MPGFAPGAARMQSIEAARGLAALAVLLMHAANLMRVDHFSGHVGMGGFFNFGYVGVDFFFVLSGFIISYIHHRDLGQPQRLPVYLWRRVVRIFPIYWFILALNLATLAGGRMLMGKDPSLDLVPMDVLSSLLLIPVAEPRFLGVAWSLQYEVMFYALFAPLILHRRVGLTVLGLWLALIVVRVHWPQLPSVAGLLGAHSLQFLLGVGLGFLARQAWFPALRTLWLLPALALLTLAIWIERSVLPQPHGDLGRVALGLASCTVLACLIGMERRPGTGVTTPAWLSALGGVSYSVYLGHIMVLNLVYLALARLGLYHHLPELVVYTLAVAVTLAVTVYIGRRVEQPLIRRLRPWVKGA